MSLPHVRGALGARGSPIERPAGSSFRAVAEASAVISYQPTQGAFAASVPTMPSWSYVGVRSPLARLPQRRIGADRGFAVSEAPISGVAEAPPLSTPPCAAARHPRHRSVIIEAWPTSTSSEPVQALVTRRPIQPGAFHHRHAPDRSRACAEHRERCRNASVTQWVGDL
jgi:hypothetical protein